MRAGGYLALATAFGLLLAGCSGSGSGSSTSGDETSGFPTATVDVEPTETTGIIRGVVVDQAIRPVVGATISIAGTQESTMSNEEGAFGFEDLAPGTYFMTAHKSGYREVQAAADVVAGVSDPDIVRIKLQADPKLLAYVQPYTHDIYIECTTSLVVLCGAPNLASGWMCDGTIPPGGVCLGNLTADTFTWNTYFDPNATMIQNEMVWQSTQTLSPDLYFEMEALEGTCDGASFITSGEGPSPLLVKANATELEDSDIGGDCPIYYSIFSGGLAGVTVEQRATMYIHAFYNYLPPEDWRFTTDSDGDPPGPP